MKCFVFDVFGTLLTFGGARRNPYRLLLEAVKETGIDQPKLPFLTRDVGIETFAVELGLEHLIPSMLIELEAEIAGISAFDDVTPILRQLQAAGHQVAVCSNLAKPYGHRVRQLLPGLDGYVLSYEVGAAKPDPAIYRAVCSVLGCEADNVLFIGDSPRCDVSGPRAFGMQPKRIDRTAGQTLFDVLKGAFDDQAHTL